MDEFKNASTSIHPTESKRVHSNAAEIEESFRRLLKVSQEAEKFKNVGQHEDNSDDDSNEEDKAIPDENIIEPTSHEEPLKSIASPEYIRKVIREMDIMSAEMLREALAAIKVSTSGTKRQLRKRVAHYYRKENSLLNRKMDFPNSDKTFRHFDYLIAIDFECTCVEVIYDYPHEIIELPAVLINVKDMKIVSTFRTYVRPVRNPILSDFCIAFTKIAQETVDRAPYFREALELLYEWMRKFGLSEKGVRFAFVTDGPHDMWKFMQFQCALSGMKMPHIFRSFINIKKIFKERLHGLVKGNGKSGIENMLEKFDLKFEGNKHSGLDDAKNIAYICLEMMKRRIELRINQKCAYKVNQLDILDDDDDEVADHRSLDISQRDFQLWMRRLPLKLQTVSRREFLNDEYMDCESCDDLTDDQNEVNEFSRKMRYREEIRMRIDTQMEEALQEHKSNKIDDIQELGNGGDSPISDSFSDSDNADDEDEEDFEALLNTRQTQTHCEADMELRSVWSRSDENQNDQALQRADRRLSDSSSSDSTILDSSYAHCRPQTQAAPRNSLASNGYRRGF
ncbi:unnamed protein product [Caenorhabditis bovis]|uniref:SAP domain-containing protein n=1 Tax=Caenorhabditis bovis TaxID=2654633 RepID=A0A8S1ESH6_9PELO|nr:unnamed protein product [Caenorhabditis bovis]